MGRRGWHKPFTNNSVCIVDACTDQLKASYTIGNNSLQFVTKWTHPWNISSRVHLALPVWPSVSGWSDVYICKSFPNVLNTERQNSAVNRRSLLETSSRRRSSTWMRKIVLIKPPRCVDWFRHGNQVYHLAESINKDKNISILMCVCGKSEDEAHWDDSQHSEEPAEAVM